MIKCAKNWCKNWHKSINHLKIRVPISEFLFTFEIKIVGIVQEYKYVAIILQELLDFQAGVNEISPKTGRALGACISKFAPLKDVGFIAYKQSFDYNVIPLSNHFTVV